MALSEGMPPFQLTFMTLGGGSVLLYGFARWKGASLRDCISYSPSLYARLFCGVGLYTLFLNLAFKNAPAFEVNMLNYIWPLLLMLFSKIFKKQNVKSYQYAGIFLGFLGACFIFMPSKDGGQLFEHMMIGHLYVLVAAVVWAGYSVSIIGQKYSVAAMVPVMFLASVLSLCLHLYFEETVLALPVQVWCVVAILAFTRLSYAMWDYGMKHGDQVLLTSLSYFIPLLSVSYFIVFGFMPSGVYVGIGGFLIVFGCIIINMERVVFSLRRLLKNR